MGKGKMEAPWKRKDRAITGLQKDGECQQPVARDSGEEEAEGSLRPCASGARGCRERAAREVRRRARLSHQPRAGLSPSCISEGGAYPPGRSAIGGGARATLTLRPRPAPPPPPRARADGSASLALARAAPPRGVRSSVGPLRRFGVAGCSQQSAQTEGGCGVRGRRVGRLGARSPP